MWMSARISYHTWIILFVSHLCACLLFATLYNEKNQKARQYFSFVTPWLAALKHPCVAIIIGFFFLNVVGFIGQKHRSGYSPQHYRKG